MCGPLGPLPLPWVPHQHPQVPSKASCGEPFLLCNDTFQLPVRVIFLALTAFEGVDYHHEDPVVVGLGYHVLSHQGPWLNPEQH